MPGPLYESSSRFVQNYEKFSYENAQRELETLNQLYKGISTLLHFPIPFIKRVFHFTKDNEIKMNPLHAQLKK